MRAPVFPSIDDIYCTLREKQSEGPCRLANCNAKVSVLAHFYFFGVFELFEQTAPLVTFSSTVSAHPHATGVATYPALITEKLAVIAGYTATCT